MIIMSDDYATNEFRLTLTSAINYDLKWWSNCGTFMTTLEASLKIIIFL